MWVKAQGDQIITYPYDMTMLKNEHPNTAFPSDISAEVMAEFDVYQVEVSSVPEYDPMTQVARLTSPVYNGTNWASQYEVSNRPEEDAAGAVREHRDGKLRSTDSWALSDRTMTQDQIDYRQALRDVPSQEGFPYSVVWPTEPS